MTQGVKNNIHICIRRICLLRIIFIFVFVHQKNYSLHSGAEPWARANTSGQSISCHTEFRRGRTGWPCAEPWTKVNTSGQSTFCHTECRRARTGWPCADPWARVNTSGHSRSCHTECRHARTGWLYAEPWARATLISFRISRVFCWRLSILLYQGYISKLRLSFKCWG